MLRTVASTGVDQHNSHKDEIGNTVRTWLPTVTTFSVGPLDGKTKRMTLLPMALQECLSRVKPRLVRGQLSVYSRKWLTVTTAVHETNITNLNSISNPTPIRPNQPWVSVIPLFLVHSVYQPFYRTKW